MGAEGYFVILIIILMVMALVRELLRPGLILFSAAIIFMFTGIINVKETLIGFSNKGVITIAILFLIGEGLRQSGGLDKIAHLVLPRERLSIPGLILRISLPISVISAFLNNTPVVVIFAPMLKKWAEKIGLNPSKFLIPLSYATIFGGMCTLIGTSTNLVVHGLMIEYGFSGLNMFELAKVGFFIAIMGILYLLLVGHRLLPGTYELHEDQIPEEKYYYHDIVITEDSYLIGMNVMQGLETDFKNMNLVALERKGKKRKPDANLTFEAEDRLTVSGNDGTLEFLLNKRGISLQGWEDIVTTFKGKEIMKFETVIAQRFPGIGRTIGEFDFMKHYRAKVIAVHRNGEEIDTQVENIRLRNGDNLIIIATINFLERYGSNKDFYLVSPLGEIVQPVKPSRMWLAIGLTVLMIIGATAGKYITNIGGQKDLDMFYFASVAVVLMVWARIISAKTYTNAIRWDVIITIASAFAISKAIENSHVAATIAGAVIDITHTMGPLGVLAGIYIITNLFTEIITNNAAAALVFPIALSAAQQLGVNPQPFFIAICIAASASFATPIGYQTNLIVQGLGNYRFRDFFRTGLALNLLALIISIAVIPIFWPFR